MTIFHFCFFRNRLESEAEDQLAKERAEQALVAEAEDRLNAKQRELDNLKDAGRALADQKANAADQVSRQLF